MPFSSSIFVDGRTKHWPGRISATCEVSVFYKYIHLFSPFLVARTVKINEQADRRTEETLPHRQETNKLYNCVQNTRKVQNQNRKKQTKWHDLDNKGTQAAHINA